jgi:hypothetical protein
VNVDVMHRQRIRNRVEKGERVFRTDIHHGPFGRRRVIESDIQRRTQTTQRRIHPLDSFREKAVQAFSGLSYLARRQQVGEGPEPLLEVAPLVGLKARARLDSHAEHVHDFAGRTPLSGL